MVRYLTPAEVRALFQAIAKERSAKLRTRDKALFALMLDYGLRIREATLLKVADIDWASAKLYVTRVKRKNYGEAYPLSVENQKLLRKWLTVRAKLPYASQLPELFISSHGKSLNDQTIYARYRVYSRRAGLPKEKQHPHCLRHTCAISLVLAKIPLLEIRERLGHSALESTLLYVKLAGVESTEMHSKMNRIFSEVRAGRQ